MIVPRFLVGRTAWTAVQAQRSQHAQHKIYQILVLPLNNDCAWVSTDNLSCLQCQLIDLRHIYRK